MSFMKKYKNLQIVYNILLIILPVFYFAGLQAQNPRGIITIKAGTVLNIGKNACLVTNSNINNKGTLINEGSIVLNGNSAQSFPGITGSIPLMNVLEIKNSSSGITLNQAIKIDKELKLTNGNLALGNYDITIRSTAGKTAAVSAIGVGAGISYGTGRFIVERFINVGTVGHTKSWQLLAVPANGKTINECWQESGAATIGFGTQITHPLGTAAGYDASTANTSIKTYNSATNSFDQGPASTSTLINNAKGYMLFVRGDRTVATGTGTVPTTLRIKGTLFTPANPPAVINVSSGKYESVGNPYASQIDFTQLTKTGGVNNVFYTWDPSLYGSYGVGGYQTMSATNLWIPVPGGGNYTGVQKTIESGQAFFVHSTGSAGSISFSESVKTGNSKLVHRTAVNSTINARQFIRSWLLTAGGLIIDGNAAAFDADLSNEVNAEDALKFMNGGINFGLKRENKLLAVEGRSFIANTDTLFYYTNNLLQQPYRILIIPENIDARKQLWLVDNFLQTQTMVSLNDSTYVNFSVTADPLSAATNRFMLVFKTQTILGVSATTLRAARNADGSIAVYWNTANENNIDNYIVEKSENGIAFKTIIKQNILMNNGAYAGYSFQDILPFKENNFYRIKITFKNGSHTYSNIVKVEPLKTAADISVYPNPVTGKLLNLYFSNQTSGVYNVVVINANAQKVWSNSILYNGSNGKLIVELPRSLSAGNYFIALMNKEGKTFETAFILL